MNFTTLIDAATLAHSLGHDDLALLDCRFDLADPGAGVRAFRDAHLPGARYADLERDLSGPTSAASGRHPLPDPRDLARRLGELGVGRTSQVVVYDAGNGSFAARAWWLLRWIGHRRVAVLDGGLAAWRAAGGAFESGEARAAPAAVPALAAHADQDATRDAADVLATLGDARHRLVDARAAERYAGTVEPIDPVAGHVPGAVNHPFARNLDEDGRFLPAAHLRERWLATLGEVPPRNVTVMCGSGVTACHDLLALEVAGLSGARLYPGSWSEWIRDPARPVARGPGP